MTFLRPLRISALSAFIGAFERRDTQRYAEAEQINT